MEGQSVVSSQLRFFESKRKLQLSAQGINISPGCKLVAAANNHSMVIIGSQEDNSIKAIPFEQLMNFNPSQTKSEIASFNQFKFVKQLNFRPTILTVARYGYSSVLLVIGQSVLEAFDLDSQTSIGQAQLGTADIIDYAWHPNYFDSLVALCTKTGELLVVSINRASRSIILVYSNQQCGSLSCCWSPKGKNLAIGMADGRVRRLEPIISATSFAFKDVDKSLITFTNPAISPQHRLVKLRWINKTHLLGIHLHSSGSNTVYSMFTVKPSAPYKYWTSICFEGQTNPDQIYYVANLSDAAVCGSSGSGEAAVLGLDGQDWKTVIIDEEGARIELPLDSSNSETFPRGLTVACLDKRPIMVFYTSDNVICAYATSDQNHRLPEFQPAIDNPLTAQAAIRATTSFVAPVQQQQPATQTLSNMLQAASLQTQQQQQAPQQLSTLQQQLQLQPQPQSQQQQHQLKPSILEMKPQSLQQQLPQQPISQQPLSQQPISQPQPQSIPRPQTPHQQTPKKDEPQTTVPQPQVVQKMMQELARDIKSIRVENLPALDAVNLIRRELEEVEEIHRAHREATEAITKDIETLDAGMLENLYLLEYIKTHSNKQTKKRYLDPATQSKVEAIRTKVEAISHKLRDVNNHVDIEWTLYKSKKTNKLDSLEMIYKTLATQQKIINTLKKKVSILGPDNSSRGNITIDEQPSFRSLNESIVPTKELDSSKLVAFREFLASRDTVPVRRPD